MAAETFIIQVEVDTGNADRHLKTFQKSLDDTAKKASAVGKGFGEGLGNFTGKIQGITNDLRGLGGGLGAATDSAISLTSGMGLAAGAIASVGIAAAAATVALIANASAMVAEADNAAETADKLGLTTTELAALSLAANENGTTVTALVGTYDRLVNSLDEVANGNEKTNTAFRKLGISQSDLAGKTKEQIAGIVIRQYELLGKTVSATAATTDILGRSFRDQVPAIKAVANELEDYRTRVLGSVASKALEEAGARQEKAFSDLGIAVKTLRLTLAEPFKDIVTDITAAVTEIVKQIERMKGSILFMPNVSFFEAFKIELQARKDAGVLNKDEGLALAYKRTLELSKQRQALIDMAEATKRLNEFQGKSTAGGGRGIVNPAFVIPDKPGAQKEMAQAKLTDEQRNTIALSERMRTSFSELDKELAIFAAGENFVAQRTTNLAYTLFDTGKGVITLADAFKIAQTQVEKFSILEIDTNTRKFNSSVKSLNADYELQLQLLTATTDLERNRIQLRAQLSKSFEGQIGGITPTQAKALEEALSKADAVFARIQQRKLDNSFRDSMRDLTEQSKEMAFEIDNFWNASKEGLINNRKEIAAIQAQIDPEGKGKNLTEAQKAQIERQVAVLEAQRRVLETNRQLQDSFYNLGDAVTRWRKKTTDDFSIVRLELVKLAVLGLFKYFGGQSNTATGSFVGGLLGGLSGGRAGGGAVEAGKSYMVGESGPERVTFARNGYVVPTQQITSATPSMTSITISPNLIVHGGVTGQSELDRKFEEFAGAIATETQKLVIRQAGSNGIYRGR